MAAIKTGPNASPGREGIEGFYILRGYPDKEFKPMPIKSEAASDFSQTIFKIRQKFHFNTDDHSARVSWEQWYEKHASQIGESTTEYLTRIRANLNPMKIPFKIELEDSNFFVTNKCWSPSNGNSLVNPDFEWPEVIQAAMNSVSCEHNHHPHNPRLTVHRDEELLLNINAFEDATRPCYHTLQSTLTHDSLKDIVRRLVSYTGTQVPISGTKPVLIKKLQSWGNSIVCTLFRSLKSTQLHLVTRILNFM
jgi:hypothetical protein